MPWTPAISPQFARPVAKNLAAYFLAHSEDALLYFGGPGVENFKYFGISERLDDKLFPMLLVLAVGTDWEIGPEGASVRNAHELIVQVSNAGPDPDLLADDIFIRVNAVTSMLSEMTTTELFAGADESRMSMFVIQPGRHVYGSFLRQSASQFYRHAASINLFISYTER